MGEPTNRLEVKKLLHKALWLKFKSNRTRNNDLTVSDFGQFLILCICYAVFTFMIVPLFG